MNSGRLKTGKPGSKEPPGLPKPFLNQFTCNNHENGDDGAMYGVEPRQYRMQNSQLLPAPIKFFSGSSCCFLV